MTAQKRKLLMLAMLAASVAFGVYMKPWERRAAQPLPTSASGGAAQVSSAQVNSAGFGRGVEVQFATAWPVRDPFAPAYERQQAQRSAVSSSRVYAMPDFRLQGIIVVDDRMACVIRGEVYLAGSQVSGWRIDEVQLDGAWVSKAAERRFLSVP